MTKIGLLSDTHGYLDASILQYLSSCDMIWHAGDFGEGVAERLETFVQTWSDRPGLTGVYGNIDNNNIRNQFPEQAIFMCEKVKVMMRHIGGYPPIYNPETKKQLLIHQPQLFISGHSHILKIMYDDQLQCLHMNPGAAGNQGWHKMRTLIRFAIDGTNIKDCEVIELGKRG